MKEKGKRKKDGEKLPPGSPGEWIGRRLLLPPVLCLLLCFWMHFDPVRSVCVCSAVQSLLTFGFYAADKRAAECGRRRIPEAALHCWEFFFGWPGAFAAQRLLRHKCIKLSYQIVFYLIVLLHLGTLYLLFYVIRCPDQ